MDDERGRLQREVAHFAALLAALAEYAPGAGDLAALLRENFAMRQRDVAEVERRRRLH